MKIKHLLIKSPVEMAEAFIAFSLNQSFYKELGKQTKEMNYTGLILIDLKACNEHDSQRFFSVPVVDGLIQFAKLTQTEVSDETHAFCEAFVQSIKHLK